MRVCVVYNYPTQNFGPQHAEFAQRFVDSYRQYPPLFDHAMIVVSNGGPHCGRAMAQFSWIKGAQFLPRENIGMDIGAYQFAARSVTADMMVFLGGASYIRGLGWLKRMVNAFETHGDALYGCSGNQGDARSAVFPHIRTTGFWCNPKWINEHPFRIQDNGQRYQYEHGPNNLTSWMLSIGKRAWVIGWHDERELHQCDSMPEGFHRGVQANLIIGDRLSSPPYYHCA